jgi:hypothetical protein
VSGVRRELELYFLSTPNQTKQPNMNTKHIIALLALSALALHPANAQDIQDKPADAKPAGETVKPADKPEGERGEHRERGGPDQKQRGPQPEMKPTAYIGVMTRGVPPEVRAQTGIGEGFGLLVEEVMPDSPAQKAGLLDGTQYVWRIAAPGKRDQKIPA